MHRRTLAAWVLCGLTLGAPAAAQAINITVDYSYDSQGFFDTQAKRDRLQDAVDVLSYRLLDDLQAIVPGGANTWTASFFNPATGLQVDLPNSTIPADTIRIYVGGRDIGSSTLGQGGPGSYGANGTQAWLTTVSTRGEGDTVNPGAVDFGPWGGSVTFTNNDAVNWHFGASPPTSGQFDFFSVALHEMTHLLGFGTSDTWDNYVSGNFFTGPASVAEYDGAGNVPLGADHAHWANGTNDGGRETAMDPSIGSGVRKPLTALDWAALSDIGWTVGPPPPLAGDVNHDGVVDVFDVNVVSAHWGESGPTGDANGDNAVNIFDVNLISANWGAIAGGGSEIDVTVVPEPAAITLALAGLLAGSIAAVCRRQSRESTS